MVKNIKKIVNDPNFEIRSWNHHPHPTPDTPAPGIEFL